MNPEQQKVLTSLDTNMGHVLEALSSMQCVERGEQITEIRIAQGKTDERVDNHNKLIWRTVSASIGLAFSLVLLLVKSFIPSIGKTP